MTRDEYYMTIAMAVRKKANCLACIIREGILSAQSLVRSGL
jgi:hypothetical protein